jgi:hypothetical protein
MFHTQAGGLSPEKPTEPANPQPFRRSDPAHNRNDSTWFDLSGPKRRKHRPQSVARKHAEAYQFVFRPAGSSK